MKTVGDPAFDEWEPGTPLPAGKYEVAIVASGQDNVLLTTSEPLNADQIADLAIERWNNGDTDELGNEWQKADRTTIRPYVD